MAEPEANPPPSGDRTTGQEEAKRNGDLDLLKTVPTMRVAPPEDPGKQKSTVAMILALVRGIRIGGDLTTLAVPPVFNIPKSQLQMFTEAAARTTKDMLGACTRGATALDRFLAVVRWHISTTRLTPFGKTPYNPILGETHHLTVGDLNVLMEQVSHHPPISALRAVNEKQKVVMTWWAQPTPKFYGGWLEAEIKGRRILELQEHGETYQCTSPRISFRFFPNPGTEWMGMTTVKCAETGYEATVEYKSRSFFGRSGNGNCVVGKVTDKDKKALFELDGRWDNTVNIKNLETGQVKLLYDHTDSISRLEAPVIEHPEALAPTESVLVWSKLTSALLDEDYSRALTEKSKVETHQRGLRKKRKEAGEIWEPTYFAFDETSNWVWKDPKQGVPRAPLVARAPEPL